MRNNSPRESPLVKPTRQQGDEAEEQACRHLQHQGLQLIERNYRCRQGEIDLIMRDRESTVFVEVRYRSNPNFGGGAESVNQRKQSKVIAAASHYLQQHPALAQRPARFDVIAINPASLEWIRDAFQTA